VTVGREIFLRGRLARSSKECTFCGTVVGKNAIGNQIVEQERLTRIHKYFGLVGLIHEAINDPPFKIAISASQNAEVPLIRSYRPPIDLTRSNSGVAICTQEN